MLSPSDKLNQLKKAIIYPFDELNDIDDHLLLLAITNQRVKKQLQTRYNAVNNQKLEFLGDSVLGLVITDIIYRYEIFKNEGELTLMKSKLVRNVSLYCFMNVKHLCQVIIGHVKTDKACADVFESIIGAIYIHLEQKGFHSIAFIKRWLRELYDIDAIIDYLLLNPNQNDVCTSVQIEEKVKCDNQLDITKAKMDIKQFYEGGYLDEYTMDELIQKEIAKNAFVSYKTQLSNFYNKYNLIQPVKYIVIKQNPLKIGVVCPINLKCENASYSIIGIGIDYSKKQAEELAAKEALEYLQTII